MTLCNPHNPTGMTWSREEPGRIGELCAANHVRVLTDKIHCDSIELGYSYILFASMSEKRVQDSVICLAPTKASSLAGLQTAVVTVPDKELHHRMGRVLNTDGVAESDTSATDMTIAASTKGDSWLDVLRKYLA